MAVVWSDTKFLIFLSGSVLQACAFIGNEIWKRRNGKNVDEGFEDMSRIEDNIEKKILVLGLEGAGKSSLLTHFTSHSIQNGTPEPPGPTSGFNVVTLEHEGTTLKIYEIGGGHLVRAYWDKYLQDTDVFVFVVDSTQKMINPALELKRLLGDERLNHVPVLILANKQDLPGAMSVRDVADAFDLQSIPSKHKVQVLPTQCPTTASRVHPSVLKAKQEMFNLSTLVTQ